MSELRWGDVLCAAIDACCAAGATETIATENLAQKITEILAVRGDMDTTYRQQREAQP